MTVQADTLPTRWQVEFQAGEHRGVADTAKLGVGGAGGLRPHELLEAALATCMTITARIWLAEQSISDDGVAVAVQVVRHDDASRFQYRLVLPEPLEIYRSQITERLEQSPVRTTLSKNLTFEPVAA